MCIYIHCTKCGVTWDDGGCQVSSPDGEEVEMFICETCRDFEEEENK